MIYFTAGGYNSYPKRSEGQNINHWIMLLAKRFNLFDLLFMSHQRNNAGAGHTGMLSHGPLGVQCCKYDIFNRIDLVKRCHIDL